VRFRDLALADLVAALQGSGIFYRIGPFSIRLRSPLPELPPVLHRLYRDYPLLPGNEFADFHVQLVPPGGFRAFWRPQVHFLIDDISYFAPFPRRIFLALMEWGLNWCVFKRAHQYLMIHAAVVEKQGYTLIMPARPGSGKSTLCAALAYRGWRLLSDEFALIRPEDLAIVPFPRLVPLKNESIAIIRQRVPAGAMGPTFTGTRKGTVVHLCPPTDSILRADEVARPGQIVFPSYAAGQSVRFEPLSRTQTFLRLTGNSFNYEQIGLRGFETMSALVESAPGAEFSYGDLEQAMDYLEGLIPRTAPAVQTLSN
jgi:HprK-related kinase A